MTGMEFRWTHLRYTTVDVGAICCNTRPQTGGIYESDLVPDPSVSNLIFDYTIPPDINIDIIMRLAFLCLDIPYDTEWVFQADGFQETFISWSKLLWACRCDHTGANYRDINEQYAPLHGCAVQYRTLTSILRAKLKKLIIKYLHYLRQGLSLLQTWKKWSIFCMRYFHLHCIEWKSYVWDSKFPEVYS